ASVGVARARSIASLAHLIAWITSIRLDPLGVSNGGRAGRDLVHLDAVVEQSNAINATLYDKLNFNFIRDIAPVACIGAVPNLIVVHPSVPAKTVSELIVYAKANPGKVNTASGGIGTPQHVAGELFKMMTGTNIVDVLYRGTGPAFTDLLGGRVQMMFATMPSSIEYVRAGKIRPLAVTTATRLPLLPDIRTVTETDPGLARR